MLGSERQLDMLADTSPLPKPCRTASAVRSVSTPACPQPSPDISTSDPRAPYPTPLMETAEEPRASRVCPADTRALAATSRGRPLLVHSCYSPSRLRSPMPVARTCAYMPRGPVASIPMAWAQKLTAFENVVSPSWPNFPISGLPSSPPIIILTPANVR
jgi:hypothetical protein